LNESIISNSSTESQSQEIKGEAFEFLGDARFDNVPQKVKVNLERIRSKNLRPKCCLKCDKKFKTFKQLHSHSKLHKYKKLKQRLNALKQTTSAFNASQENDFEFIEIHDCESASEIQSRTHNSQEYECSQCYKSFTAKIKLTRHKRIHTRVKPYECDQCDRKFLRNDHFKAHKRIHTGERPYECDQCKKRFMRLTELTRHKGTHSRRVSDKFDVC